MRGTMYQLKNKLTEEERFFKHVAKYKLDDQQQPWFFRLCGDSSKDTGLKGYYGEHFLKHGVVIARDALGKRKEYKKFTWFPSFDICSEWVKKQETDCNFYELIGATTKSQHPYFDIDMSPEELDKLNQPQSGFGDLNDARLVIRELARELEKDLIALMRTVHPQYNPDHLEKIIYESIYPINPKTGRASKFSYHIVFYDVYFEGFEGMKAFGEKFKIDHLKYDDVVDSIWGRSRQLRMFGSYKRGKDPSTQKTILYRSHPEKVRDHFVTRIMEGDHLLPTPVMPDDVD